MNIFQILLTQPLANGLAIFYKLLGNNLGWAIALFSIFLRLVLTPLTKPYLTSMKKMREYAPQLEKLKKKHKDDKKKLMEAQAQFYKEKGINPGAGCLPYILQIVVLIAFYRVFSQVLIAEGDVVGKFNELLYQPIRFASDDVINTHFLGIDLTQPDNFNFAFLPFALPGIFVILAAVTQFLSVKISSSQVSSETAVAKETKEPTDDIQVAMQNSMIYTMPLITLYMGYKFPAGLAVYWFVVSFYNLVQQAVIYRPKAITTLINKTGLIQLSESDGRKNRKSKKSN